MRLLLTMSDSTDSTIPSCDLSVNTYPVSPCSDGSLNPATIEQIVNWTLGRKLLDGFYPESEYKTKEKGGNPADYLETMQSFSYYPASLGSAYENYTPTQYNSASSIGKNQINDTLFKEGYYGEKVDGYVIDENVSADKIDNYGGAEIVIGALTYNVPTESQSFPATSVDGYYQILGSNIKDYALAFFIPDEDYPSFWADNTAPVQSVQTPLTTSYGQIGPNIKRFTIPASDTYTFTNSSLVKRSASAAFNLKYELKEQLNTGLDGVMSDSVTEEVKASLDLDFSTAYDKYSSKDYETSFSGGSVVKNPTDQTIFYTYVSMGSAYNAPFTLPGYITAYQSNINELASGVTSSPATDQVYGKYENTDLTKIEIYHTNDVYDLLTETASSDSGFNNTYSSTIIPEKQQVTSSGTYTANNTQIVSPFFFFYNEEDCGSIDANTLASESYTCSGSSSRSDRRSDRGLTWKNFQQIHDNVFTNEFSKIKYKDESGKQKLKIGSGGQTKSDLINIGTNQSDYYFNPLKKQGAAILHEGGDFYVGHKQKDFVSSKSVGGQSTINTRAGKDFVFIDASASYEKITHGSTDLGAGNDKYKILGSKSEVNQNDFQAEFVETGSGKDTVIVNGNVKLVITDFNIFKDELIIDFENYRMKGNHADIVFTNEEGSTIALQGLATAIHLSERFDRISIPEITEVIEPHADPYISDIHNFAYSQIAGYESLS